MRSEILDQLTMLNKMIPHIGRPTKLDDERCRVICEAVANGNTYKAAAMTAGVSYSRFKAWMRRGRSKAPDDGAFRAFRAAVKRAEAAAEMAAVARIRQAADSGQWQAAAWLLERRYPLTWGRIDRVRAQIAVGAGRTVLVPHSIQQRLAT